MYLCVSVYHVKSRRVKKRTSFSNHDWRTGLVSPLKNTKIYEPTSSVIYQRKKGQSLPAITRAALKRVNNPSRETSGACCPGKPPNSQAISSPSKASTHQYAQVNRGTNRGRRENFNIHHRSKRLVQRNPLKEEYGNFAHNYAKEVQ